MRGCPSAEPRSAPIGSFGSAIDFAEWVCYKDFALVLDLPWELRWLNFAGKGAASPMGLLDLISFNRAVESLDRALAVCQDASFYSRLNLDQQNTLRAGVIQNFEFTYELAWKFMKRFLELDLGSAAVDGLPRKELFRIAAEQRLIDDVATWFDFHTARNRTTHTYDPKVAAEVQQVALRFAPAARALLGELEKRNA